MAVSAPDGSMMVKPRLRQSGGVVLLEWDRLPRIQLSLPWPVAADGFSTVWADKNGKGFYTKEGAPDPEALPLINPDNKQKEYSVADLQEMLFTPFAKTGYELLQKKVVADPRSIDIGAIWGVGFPADKGGPMKWADLIGISEKLYGKKFYK